jgi:hypothetical protein
METETSVSAVRRLTLAARMGLSILRVRGRAF